MTFNLYFLVILCLVFAMYYISAIDLQADTFVETVVDSDKVWVVEFYSSMCGSCQEFAPIWKKVKGAFTNVEYGEVNIDQKPGMELAQRLGALEEGIPLVRVFREKDNGKGWTLPLSKYFKTMFYVFLCSS